ncbi:hypothetical protein L343_2016 [Escherichia coli CE549]|nr:hypothetical protein L343_2016 [Escherichia coli CE549]
MLNEFFTVFNLFFYVIKLIKKITNNLITETGQILKDLSHPG